MARQKLNSLLEPKEELSELNKLLKSTQKQIDDAVEQGNDALLALSDEFEELAEKKRKLLRDMEELEEQYNKLKDKMKYAENTYGKYLATIKSYKEEE